MKFRMILLLLLAGFVLPAQEAEETPGVRSFNLAEAQAYALENNYSIRNQEYEVQKAQQTIRETASLYIPQVSGNYDVTHNAILQPIAFPAEMAEVILGRPAPEGQDFVYENLGGGKFQNTAGITANWMIGNVSNFLAKKASEVLKETRSLEKEEAELAVRAEVAQAFYRVQVLAESADLLDQNLSSLQKNLYETRQLFENGFVEEQDVDQIELLVSNLENNLNNARRQHTLARQMLKFQMGIPLEQEIAVEGSLDESMAAVEEKLLSMDQHKLEYEDHVQYRKVSAEHRASVLQFKNERADRYPSLSFSTNYSQLYVTNDFEPVNFDTYWAPAWSITGSLKWDLFTGFAREAQIQQARIDIDRAEMAKEQTENQLKLEYEQAKSDFLHALDSYRTSKKNVGISKKIRDKTRVKYSEGISSSLDLTQAENQYLDTQSDYIQALQNLLFAKEDLDKALGKQ